LRFSTEEHRYQEACKIHEALGRYLAGRKGFFDWGQDFETSIHLSSLDILAYAFLKEELINTPKSAEVVLDLTKKHPNLISFVKRMD